MTPIRTVLGLTLSGLFLAVPLASFAQDYPSKPIRMIVPFSAGGPTDVLARSLAKSMGEVLGQPIIVDNRPGAGGSIGIDGVAKAAPDGYTIGMAHTGTTAINPHLYPRHLTLPLESVSHSRVTNWLAWPEPRASFSRSASG